MSNAGTIVGSGYNLTVGGAGNTTINSIIGTGAGTFTKDGTGTVILTGANTYTGMTTVNGGTLELTGSGAENRVLTGGGGDVMLGRLVFNYPYADTVANIAAKLTYSYYSGNWSRGQFRSTGHALGHGLGWLEDGSDLTVRYTLYGDANLDGYVNQADRRHRRAPANYGQSGKYWYQGDFNYDGWVNGSDLNILVSNWGQYQAVLTAVPEPSTLALAFAGLLGLVAYAWRKRK